MKFLTTHFVNFVIGSVDWVAEIEVDGDGYSLTSVAMDLGGGKQVGCIEGEDLDMHGTMDGYQWKSFNAIVRGLMTTRLSDFIAEHEEERGQNEYDSLADHYRERNEP